ncbi:MAG: hypothetical protein AAF235_08240, partial [Planctomycetota bacterium]
LAIPGGCAVVMLTCAVLTALGRSAGPSGRPKPIAMIGVHAGLILPLLFTAAFASRAVPTLTGFLDARAATEDRDVTEQLAERVLNPDDADATADALSKDYLVMTLWGCTGLSLTAFTGLILLRPKPGKPGKPSKPSKPSQPSKPAASRAPAKTPEPEPRVIATEPSDANE